jgi:cytoskeletal protein RodZ
MSDQTNLPPSAAALLLQARQAKELTLDQVSLQTRIPRDLIQALEDKNWNALPGAPYARAFCKTLAQAYELDPELVLTGLRNDMGMTAAKPQASTQPVEIKVASSKEEAQTSKTPLILAAILAVALVLVLAATRLAFKPSSAPSPSPTDSLRSDSVSADTTIDSLPAPASLAPATPVAPAPKTATIKLVDTARPAFILYMRSGVSRIRKKSLTSLDTLEFNPDTGILIRNLSKIPLKIVGAIKRDSVSTPYFRVVRKSDSVRFEPISESTWEDKTSSILEHKKAKKEN